MTKPTEFITPNLLEIGEEIVKRTKQGFRLTRGPEQLGWQYYCEFVMDDVQEVVQETATENPIPMPSPGRSTSPKPKKVKAAPSEA